MINHILLTYFKNGISVPIDTAISIHNVAKLALSKQKCLFLSNNIQPVVQVGTGKSYFYTFLQILHLSGFFNLFLQNLL